MAMRRKTITLTERLDEWVKDQIATGNFGNDSEYIRDLIRRDKDYRDKLGALREALIEGENSGPAVPYDFESILGKARITPDERG